MLVKRITDCREFEANDGSFVKELLHRKNEDISFGCSVAHARVPAGGKTAPHVLGERAEAYIVLEGEGIVHVGEESEKVGRGNIVYIPAGKVQWVENTGDSELVFLCIVDPAWSAEDDNRV